MIGYALVMETECRTFIPVLYPMFDMLDSIEYPDGHPVLTPGRSYIMGQICVDKSWRGKGVAQAMYAEHRRVMSQKGFELCITEISTKNIKSMRAHERAGFKVIKKYQDSTDSWAVVAMDLKSTH